MQNTNHLSELEEQEVKLQVFSYLLEKGMFGKG